MELSFLLKQPHLMQAASDHMDPGYIAAVTFTGLVVVFLALILLVAFLYLMGLFFNRKKDQGTKSGDTAPQQTKSAAPATPATAAPMEDESVVAAICAAVSMMGAADGTAYAVKSIRPAKNKPAGRPAWYMAGLRDNTTPF